MEVKVNAMDHVAVVTIATDQLDAGNVRDFKTQINPVAAENKRLVFDLSAVRFIDSSGLGAVLSYLRRQHEAGGDLKLTGLTQPVRMLFELVRMHRIFEIYGSVEEAVGAYQQAAQPQAALSAA